MKKLWLDLETRSRVNLKKSSVYRYVEPGSDFKILMCSWSRDKKTVQTAFTEKEIRAIPGLFDDDVLKIAWNSSFERISLSAFSGLPVGRYLNPEAFDDPMVIAAERGYPQKLEFAARVLGAQDKDSAGTRLINLFSKPNRKGEFNDEHSHPKEWAEFVAYCEQDVRTLIDLDERLGGWPAPGERERWIADQRVNDAGIPVDVKMAEIAVQTAEDNAFGQDVEFMQLTGVSNPNSGVQVIKWLREQGLQIDNLQAKTVDALLLDPELDPTVQQVLELRQELALVAAKKFLAATERVNSDGRLRGAFHFFGAHTGRWAGRGVQLQNLPRATLAAKDDSDEVVDAKIQAAVDDLKAGRGADAYTLKALVRAMFTGPFTVVDYSAIEARVVAWLAGEEWALQAFRDGRDIYVETAERMGGLSRQEGKVAVLALGYGGGVQALRQMGAEGSDDKLKFLRDQWREANPSIKGYWRELESAFRYGDRAVGDHIYVLKDGADRYVQLPSGRSVGYHRLKGKMEQTPWGEAKMRISYASPQIAGRRVWTWGGTLTENITQAVARDVLAEAIVKLQAHGHEVVGHVHDEALILGTPSIEEISEIMVDPPEWSTGLPIAAEGFQCPRYRKG